jgi:2-polyprenyl-3-methyl-5-hydroxy-6-metoxy-1,4-benzoquinol methylase
MSIQLFPRAALSATVITELNKSMAAFYRHPPVNYYQIANQAAQQYTVEQQPFHCDLAGRVYPGATVLEVGCGTAHLCPKVEKHGGSYTGLDYSKDLLAENRKRYPQARFFEIGTDLNEHFDIVASLYVLEHVTDPPAYLESLWNYCRPGGHIGIICPEFVENPTITPAVFYGKTARRFREKLQTLSLLDAAGHLLDLKVWGPRWKKTALATPPGAFWINLEPHALHTADFFSDADAVHMAHLKDIIWFFQNKDAEIVQTSARMKDIPPEILNFNLYSLVRKPFSQGK